MSDLYAEGHVVKTRSSYVTHLAVLGAGLVVAGLHSGGSGATSAAPAAAVTTYRPPVVVTAPAPTAEVHTMSGVSTRPPARPKAAARRTPTRVTVHPKPTTHTAKPTTVRRTTTTVRPIATSFQQALNAAIARIPTYRSGAARWVVSRAYAFWGTADWYHDVLYVSPDVPTSKLYDVAVHEWSHELSVLDYGGDVAAATAAMNAWFGGTDLTGAERAADCMAILQGARWTHYTTCTNAQWRLGAARLVAGQRL